MKHPILIFRESEEGQSLVEFALMLPVLLLVLAIVVDLGSVFFVSIAVIDAARDGARYGVNRQIGSEMCAQAMSGVSEVILPPGANLSCTADTGHGSGTPAKVTVSCDIPLIFGGIVGRSSVPVSYTAAFRIR